MIELSVTSTSSGSSLFSVDPVGMVIIVAQSTNKLDVGSYQITIKVRYSSYTLSKVLSTATFTFTDPCPSTQLQLNLDSFHTKSSQIYIDVEKSFVFTALDTSTLKNYCGPINYEISSVPALRVSSLITIDSTADQEKIIVA